MSFICARRVYYLRGVDISTSWLSDDHPLDSRMRWWSRANVPGFSVFQKIRAHARMKWSWNSRWWNERFQPLPARGPD